MKRLLLLLSLIFQLSINASDLSSKIDVQIIDEKTETTRFIPIKVESSDTVETIVQETLRQTSPETPVNEVSVMHRGSPVALSDSVATIEKPHRLVLWIKNTKQYERAHSHSAPLDDSKIKMITIFLGNQTEQFEIYPLTTWKELKKQIYQRFHVKPIDPDDNDLQRITLERDKEEGKASQTMQRIIDGGLKERVLDTFKRDGIKKLKFYLYLQPFKNQNEHFNMAGKSMDQLHKEQQLSNLAKAIAPDIKKYNLSRLKLRKTVNMLNIGYELPSDLERYRSLAESLQIVDQQDQEQLFNSISQALHQEYFQEQQQNEILLQERADFAEQDDEEEARYDAMMEALINQELAAVTKTQPAPDGAAPIPARSVPFDEEETF